MTQQEITNQSNLHKFEYNKCNQHVEDFDKSIVSFVKFREYLNRSKNKTKRICKNTLISGCVSLFLTSLFLFINLPISIIFLIVSALIFERCIFFNKIFKKFDRCVSYLSKLITNLSTKQLDYATKRDLEMEEIMKLEKTTPDEISKYVALEVRPEIEDNLDVIS